MAERQSVAPGGITTIRFDRPSGCDPEWYPATTEVSVARPDMVELTEKLNSISTGSHTAWKPCQHYKLTKVSDGGGEIILSDQRYSGGSPNTCYLGRSSALPFILHYYGSPSAPINGDADYLYNGADGSIISKPSGFADLEAQGLRTLIPMIRSELSIFNSLYELKDFKSTVAKATGLASLIKRNGLLRTVQSLPSLAKHTVKSFKEMTYKELLTVVKRNSSSAFLQYKFAWAPLVSDIMSVYKALALTERRINKLVTEEGRTQKKHFGFNWYEASPVKVDGPGDWRNLEAISPPLLGAVRLSKWVINRPTQFHSEIEYNVNFTQYQREHARLLGYLDAFGVQLNPAIIWNAMRWTFVIDWVVNVSSYLNSFKIGNLEPRINIHRYLTSFRRERDIMCECESTYALSITGPNQSGGKATGPTYRETAYGRYVGVPDLNSLQTSGVNLSEFTLASALVLSRRPRRTRV